MLSYEAIVLKGADHFLMLGRPVEFNRALRKAVRMLSGGRACCGAADERGTGP